jgi:hypothetical protein
MTSSTVPGTGLPRQVVDVGEMLVPGTGRDIALTALRAQSRIRAMSRRLPGTGNVIFDLAPASDIGSWSAPRAGAGTVAARL